MNYKLNPELAKIESPVVLVIDGEEQSYENGTALLHLNFKQNYLIDKNISQNISRIIEF